MLRYVLGFHSDRLNELQAELSETRQEQRTMREAARQIDEFLHRYGFASKATIEAEIDKLNDEEERVRAMAALITPLGVDAESYFALDGPAFSAAAAASEAFAALRGSHRGLEQQLAGRDEKARGVIDHAFAYEGHALSPNDGWKRQLLGGAYEEIEQNWAVVMLLPNGPYERTFRGIVEILEPDNGAGLLNRDEQALLALERAVAAERDGSGTRKAA